MLQRRAQCADGEVMRQRKRAGRRAAQRYSELRKLWLRRTRRQWTKVAAVLAAMGIGINAALLWLPSNWNWAAGAATGALLAMFVIARDAPPAYIEQWLQGSWGEERTERALRALEREGWQVHHDLPATRGNGNLDHVVVGPGGVFLLDSKWWSGEAIVEGDVAVLRRLEDPSLTYHYDASKRIIPLVMQVRELLRSGTRATQYVHAVVVIWGSFPQQVAGGRCTYVQGDRLAHWLREQPQRVAPERVAQFSAALQG